MIDDKHALELIDSALKRWGISYMHHVDKERELEHKKIFSVIFSKPTREQPIPHTTVNGQFVVHSTGEKAGKIEFVLEQGVHRYDSTFQLTDSMIDRMLDVKARMRAS